MYSNVMVYLTAGTITAFCSHCQQRNERHSRRWAASFVSEIFMSSSA